MLSYINPSDVTKTYSALHFSFMTDDRHVALAVSLVSFTFTSVRFNFIKSGRPFGSFLNLACTTLTSAIEANYATEIDDHVLSGQLCLVYILKVKG